MQYKIIAISRAFSCEIIVPEKKVVSELKRIKKIYQLTAKVDLISVNAWHRYRTKKRVRKVRRYDGDKLIVNIQKLN